MKKGIEFTEKAKKALAPLGLRKADIDTGLRSIDREGGSIRLEVFQGDKIEKVVLCSIKIHETSVLESTVMVWPDDKHCFPVLWCNLTVIPGVMNVPIFDFIPMMDSVVWPDYGENYVMPLHKLRRTALQMFGDDIVQMSVDLPSRTVNALSPYNTVIMISDRGITKVPSIAREYIKDYIDLVKSAVPMEDKNEEIFYLYKKAATGKLMRANDPGYHYMVNVFGADTTRKVFDIVF